MLPAERIFDYFDIFRLATICLSTPSGTVLQRITTMKINEISEQAKTIVNII